MGGGGGGGDAMMMTSMSIVFAYCHIYLSSRLYYNKVPLKREGSEVRTLKICYFYIIINHLRLYCIAKSRRNLNHIQ